MNKLFLYLFFLLVISSFASATINISDAKSYWSMDVGTEDNASSYTLTAFGSPAHRTYAQGCIKDGCYYLDGLNDEFRRAAFSMGTAWTFCMWANVSGNAEGLFDSAPSSANTARVRNVTLDRLQFEIWNQNPIAEVSHTPREWQHYCVLYTTAGARAISVYVDGALANSTTGTGTTAVAWNTFTIGSVNHGNFFKGMIDEWITYNRFLNESEIEQVYNNGLGGCPADNSTCTGVVPKTHASVPVFMFTNTISSTNTSQYANLSVCIYNNFTSNLEGVNVSVDGNFSGFSIDADIGAVGCNSSQYNFSRGLVDELSIFEPASISFIDIVYNVTGTAIGGSQSYLLSAQPGEGGGGLVSCILSIGSGCGVSIQNNCAVIS